MYQKNAHLKKAKNNVGNHSRRAHKIQPKTTTGLNGHHKISKDTEKQLYQFQKKVIIYNTYARFILFCNFSAWWFNKTSNDKTDAFHRKQLRQCLDILYPKVVKNEEIYGIINQKNLSTHFSKKTCSSWTYTAKKHPDLRHTPWHYPTESGKSVTIHQLTSSRPTGTIRAPVCSKTGLRRPREDVCDSTNQAAWSDLKRENGTVFKIFGVIWGWTQVSNKDLLL